MPGALQGDAHTSWKLSFYLTIWTTWHFSLLDKVTWSLFVLSSLSTVLSGNLARFVSQALSASVVFPAFFSCPLFLPHPSFSLFHFLLLFIFIIFQTLLHLLHSISCLSSPFSAPFSSAHILSLHSQPSPHSHRTYHLLAYKVGINEVSWIFGFQGYPVLLHSVANIVKDFLNVFVDLSVGNMKELQKTQIEPKHLQERRAKQVTMSYQVSGSGQCS